MKWVKGTKSGAFIPVFQAGSVAFSPIRVTTGYVGAPGVALPLNSPSAYPSFALAELPEQSVDHLAGVLEWAVGEVTRSRDGMMELAME
jgi:hypothetical protein